MPISTKLGTKHQWVKGIQVFHALFQGKMITKVLKFFDEIGGHDPIISLTFLWVTNDNTVQ